MARTLDNVDNSLGCIFWAIIIAVALIVALLQQIDSHLTEIRDKLVAPTTKTVE